MPTNLIESFTEALADPNLLSLKAEIALHQAKIDHVIESAQGDSTRLNWPFLLSLMESKRKLHESEAKRLQLIHGYVEATAVVSLLSSFAFQIKILLEDQDIPRAELMGRVQQILSRMLHKNTQLNESEE